MNGQSVGRSHSNVPCTCTCTCACCTRAQAHRGLSTFASFFHPDSCTLNGPSILHARQTDSRLLPPACVAPAGAREKPHRPIDHRELRMHVPPCSSSSLPLPSRQASKQSLDTHSDLRVTYPPLPFYSRCAYARQPVVLFPSPHAPRRLALENLHLSGVS